MWTLDVYGVPPERVDWAHFVRYEGDQGRSARVCQIRRRDLLDFLHHVEQTRSRPRAVRERAALFPFFAWLVEDAGVLADNPLVDVGYKSPPRARSPRAILTDEEATRLRRTVERVGTLEDQVWLALMAESCLRFGEVRNLRVGDLDFSTGAISIPGARAKNHTGDKRIMSKRVERLLREHLQATGRYYDPGALVLGKGKHPIYRRTIGKRLRAFGREAALGKEITPHCLRHTGATLALDHGMPIAAVQQLLGHKKMSSTAIYARSERLAAERKIVELNPLVPMLGDLLRSADPPPPPN